jgi:tRNA nucleotidyltransferase (CCA-adding enzyme)
MAKFYLVGGAVRDKLLNIPSKDLDYACEAESYEAMRQAIIDRGGTIFLETPEYFTIRAKVPELGASDFVLCRKESNYSDGRRPDKVEMGTLYDDLARRDFTVNAMAQGEDGNLIDPFGGYSDLLNNILRCVGNAYDRFNEDHLRLLRAVRFYVTKGFQLDDEIKDCLNSMAIMKKLMHVSQDRIREEMHKMFKHNTVRAFYAFVEFPHLMRVFQDHGGSLWLKPTTEQ